MSRLRRRILFVDHVSKVLGGAEINLVELLDLPAAREAWEIGVACANGSPLADKLTQPGIRCFDYGFAPALNELRIVGRRFNPLAKFRGLQEIKRAAASLDVVLREFSPSTVFSCTNKDHFAAGAAARRASIPSAWWINDLLTADFFPWPVRLVFLARARRLARRLLPVSDFGRDALLAGGLAPGRVTTIHNGIDLARYRRVPDAGTRLREATKAAPNEPVIGIVGRLTPWKGQHCFIDIARHRLAAGQPGQFVIIGRAFNEDAPYEAALRQTVAEHQLADRVHFLPFQSDISATLSALDVLLHCSLKPEPFGRVLIEAMAVGVPVIAARAGGVPEIVEDGRTGLLSAPGDVAGYARRLDRLLEDPALRESLIRAARQHVEARFTLARVFADFDRVCAEISPG